MARLGKVYRGPELTLWRRLALRHSRSLAATLAFTWVALMLAAMVAGWRPASGVMSAVFVLFASMVVLGIWAARERDRLVREAPLPQFLKRKLRDAYPHLSVRDTELVERGLRQFFLACQRSRKKFVAMPSRVVDSMWHEFILHTSAYREWCDLVIGRFIDHVPAEVLGRKAATNDGLRRVWYWACRDESIQPRKPSRLPLLFALDAKLAIPDGFHYVADCSGVLRAGTQNGAYCGESFSDGSYSGDAEGFGGSDGSASSGGGGAESSDGGDGGCGGGCGGD
ncbi:MAG: glycine-rich domain-containing protein [Polaromonas sp.]